MEAFDIKKEIGVMDTGEVEFYATEGEFTSLRCHGVDYPNIELRRIMPTQYPMNYISVADAEKKEIGILQAVSDLSPYQQEIVENELDSRYYSPTIVDVVSVIDKMGYVYIELLLCNKSSPEFKKSFAVKNASRNTPEQLKTA